MQTPSTYRPLLEPLLVTVGSDPITGAEVWGRYRAMEVEEFEDQVETGDSQAAAMTKKYIIQDIFTRQLGLPLFGNEKLLQELESFLGEHCEGSDIDIIRPDVIKLNFDAGVEKRDRLVGFEERLLSLADSGEAEGTASTSSTSSTTTAATTAAAADGAKASPSLGARARVWREYFQLEEASPARAARLYERAVLSAGQGQRQGERQGQRQGERQGAETRRIFEEYADFACRREDWPLLASVTARGTIAAYNDVSMWRLRLLALELGGQGEGVFLAAHQLSLSSGFSSPADYLSLLMLKCDYYRRALASVFEAPLPAIGSLEEGVGRLREAFSGAEAFMRQYYPAWTDGWAALLRRRVSLEDSLVADVAETVPHLSSHSPAAWEAFMSDFGKVCGAGLWKEYVTWALVATRDLGVCRQILRKGIAVTGADAPAQEALCLEAVAFEERHGQSAQSVLAVILKVKPKLASIAQTRAASLSVLEAAAVPVADTVADKNEGEIKPTNLKVPKVPKTEYADKKNLKRAREGSDSQENSNSKKPKEENEANETSAAGNGIGNGFGNGSGGGRATMDVVGDVAASSNSIFIKNVAFATTEEEMLTLCKTCGDVDNFEFLKSDSGKFKGMVQVHFKSPEEALKAVETMNGHPVHNRKLTVELLHASDPAPTGAGAGANGKHGSSGSSGSSGSGRDGEHVDSKWHPTTVFASKLPPAYGDDEVKAYFEVFGTVKIARVLVDKHTGESKVRYYC
jgi:RNA recognition motif-containing protein